MGENPPPLGEDFSIIFGMEHYRKSSRTTYDIKFHLVWITKYRKAILVGDMTKRARELIREVCRTWDVEISILITVRLLHLIW